MILQVDVTGSDRYETVAYHEFGTFPMKFFIWVVPKVIVQTTNLLQNTFATDRDNLQKCSATPCHKQFVLSGHFQVLRITYWLQNMKYIIKHEIYYSTGVASWAIQLYMTY